MEINKLALKAFYKSNKDSYIVKRSTGNNPEWDEEYKWKYLPEANEALSKFDTVNIDNINEIIAVVNKHKANFAHWIDMDDLKLLIDKPNGFQIIREIWNQSSETIGKTIDIANDMSFFMLGKKFSPSTYGYILAAQNCDKFTIYRDSLFKEVAVLNYIDKPVGLSQGEKYQILNDSATYIGELMKEEKEKYSNLDWYTALNGQDFLYINIQYVLDRQS